MGKINWEKMKRAEPFKIWWCKIRHNKKYNIYPVWDEQIQAYKNVSVYGCIKCDIWRKQ